MDEECFTARMTINNVNHKKLIQNTCFQETCFLTCQSFQVRDGIVVFVCVTSTSRCHLVGSRCLSHGSFLPFQSFSFASGG